MKDPQDGGLPPGGGASRGRAVSKRRRHRRSGRQKAARLAEGLKEAEAPPGEAKQAPPRKRRKRRRARKVYARDGAAITGGPSQPTAPGSTAPGSRTDGAAAPVRVGAPPKPFVRTGTDEAAFAALDLGTNNCRLLVAVPTRPGRFRVVDAFSRIVRLGEGLSTSGRLGEAAMDRALEALAVCADKLKARRIRRARLIATEACRSAENGQQFIERVREETGLVLEVIDRETEARLAVSGCGSLVETDTQGVVLFDIGGGSSEIALIDIAGRRAARLARHIVSWVSLPVGVVSLSERFGGRHVTSEIFGLMVDEVSAHLQTFEGRERLSHVASGDRFHLLGTSGTVTTLAGIHLGLPRYDRRRVDGLWMDNGEVDRMIGTLLGWEFQQRVDNPCIGADRADLVLAGCAILEAIRSVWPSQRLRVADRGLREGILTELMAEEGVWRRGRGKAKGGRP
ncbi:Ppx/GppA phosphatase family protein [Mesorhizobium xinjiangense]|uniref:Ppx/GppA phosphatase family protein n=1 Tax=Mesorhizobium xinjiangense TaxID=2678685 RepID=UPI001F310B87|nr:Ppx/GppA phosphatase family protein [Mesorhizobium xinjiangense]